MSRYAVGQPAVKIAEMAGISVPKDTKVIVVKPEKYGRDDLFSKEKMCPVISAYAYETWEEGVDMCA